jgi:thymidylate synthase (FAD)
MKAELIDNMGSDLTVVNAARVSFDKESNWEIEGEHYDHYVLSKSDKGLIHYLASHGHWTPFSHCTITLRETIPIFVARQRFKHMVGFTYNEVSRRYVDDTPEFFWPQVWRARPGGSVKQGSGSEEITEITFAGGIGQSVKDAYEDLVIFCKETYETMINNGVAPEQARMVLPQSMYTSYYCTGSLYAFARAYKLRTTPDAQKEIRDLADMWDEVIRPLYPVSWGALCGG